MLNDIVSAYLFRAPLGRLPFILAILAVFVLVGVGERAIGVGIICSEINLNCITAAVYSLYAFQAIAIFPPCVARLRDIDWPWFLAFFLSILAFLTWPIQMVISLLNMADLISTSYVFSGFNLVGSTLLLLLLAVLASAEGKQPD